jgi:virginiamycin B lyase
MSSAIVALTLVGSLASAIPAAASAPPGGIAEYAISNSSGYLRGGITSGPDGNIWFTESSGSTGEIGRITTEGMDTEYLIPTAEGSQERPESSFPSGIAQGPGASMWFTDEGTNNESEYFIGRITLKQGEAPQIKEFPIPPKEIYPREIAEGPDGAMWFTATSPSGGQIGRINAEGAVTQYPIPIAPASQEHPEFSEPNGIGQGPDGHMWFTDDGTNNEGKSFIGRIDTSTGKVDEFLIPTKESYPHGIAQGSNGDMWFNESPGVSQIGQITPTGEVREFPVPSTSYSLEGIALGPDGNMWFTEGYEANAIGRITASGEVKGFPIPTKGTYPQGIVRGPEGNMWFIEQDPTEVSPTPGAFYHVGELTTPFVPVSASPPAISGAPTQGQALSASQGSWTNGPGAFAYQWQDCDTSGGNCTNLSSETGITHFLGAGDVGHTLRVVVTATNIAGSTPAVSAPTAVVRQPAPPPPPVLARVESSMTWTFGWSRKFTIVESLVAHGVPAGGHVEVVCHGHGCPFPRHRSATVARHQSCHGRGCKPKAKSKHPTRSSPEVSLTGLFKGRHLGVGARISVSVVKPGWIGKSFVFTVRASRTPHVQIACLAPGSSDPGRGC